MLIMIKTPQLIGIIAGCLVFIITIVVVFYLLYASGALDILSTSKSRHVENSQEKDLDHFHSCPKLYDELLFASRNLTLIPNIKVLEGTKVKLEEISKETIPDVIESCNGSPIFGESSYNPARIWSWMDNSSDQIQTNQKVDNDWPSSSLKSFLNFYMCSKLMDYTEQTQIVRNSNQNFIHIVITDIELNKPIGMISILDNKPKHLTARLGNIWITPYFQGKKRSHEAIHVILKWLFESGYRRIVVEADSRHIIFRKFVERCGFKNESTLRKHMIVNDRNRDTFLYVILNSEWPDMEIKLKLLLGVPLRDTKKVAAIESNIVKKLN